jgi:hypothetical protein
MIRSRTLNWLLVLFLALLAIFSKLKFNGLILNFDYGIYQPDGSHYAYRTLVFMGVDPDLAADRVVDWYKIHGFKNNIFTSELLSAENANAWGLVAPRIMYSLLSIPFVYLFGIPGMMVIPVCSFLILIFTTYRISEIMKNRYVGIALVVAITNSPTVLRWMIANITDSLLAGLFALVVLVIIRSSSNKGWITWIIGLITITSLTRFCLPIWLAISLVYWVNKMRMKALVICITSIVAFIPSFMLMPTNAVLPGEGELQGLKKLFLLGKSFLSVSFIEVAQLAALDRILLLLLASAFVMSVKYRTQLASQMFLAVLLAVWTIGAINGTLGVNFRYQLPVLGFACWVILINSIPLANWVSGRRIDIIGKETQNKLNSD